MKSSAKSTIPSIWWQTASAPNFPCWLYRVASWTKRYLSPTILNMERMITDMMGWANVTEEELQAKGEIETNFGEVISWEYLQYVRRNPILWDVPTEILYAGQDNLTSRQSSSGSSERLHPTSWRWTGSAVCMCVKFCLLPLLRRQRIDRDQNIGKLWISEHFS